MFWRKRREANRALQDKGAAKFSFLDDAHLAGFWLNDPDWAETHRFIRTATLFYGTIFFCDLHLREDPETGEPTTERVGYTYGLSGDQITVMPHLQPANDVDPITYPGRWRFDEAGKLWLHKGGIWTPLIPATIDDMERVGFPRPSLDAIMLLIQVTRRRYIEVYRPPWCQPGGRPQKPKRLPKINWPRRF